MTDDKRKHDDGKDVTRPKVDPEWLKHSDETLRKAARETSPRFRITEGQRRAFRSS